MMKKSKAISNLLLIIFMLMVPSAANACRTIVPHDATMAKYENVVLVSVTSATRLNNPGFNEWQVTAGRMDAIAGAGSQSDYTFITAQSSTGCGVKPLPSAGEIWVVYHHDDAPAKVLDAFPLALAAAHDPRLSTIR